MNEKFDQLAKGMARAVNRRQALRQFGRFGLTIAGVTLASLGLTNKAAPTRTSTVTAMPQR